MTFQSYLNQTFSLSLRARVALALRCFERYIRVRGIEDDSIWECLEHLWQLPVTPVAELDTWEKKRGDLVDFGLGDEIPEELEEELCGLGIDEDYFEKWVTAVVELIWPSVLKAPQREESAQYLEQVLTLAHELGMELPDLTEFTNYEWGEDVWEAPVSVKTRDSWCEAGTIALDSSDAG